MHPNRRIHRSLGLERLEPRVPLAADSSPTACAADTSDLDFNLLGDAADAPSLTALESKLAVADPGASRSTALDLGTLGDEVGYSERIGFFDWDVFRFETTSASTFELTLSGLRSDLDLYVYDVEGHRIAASRNGSADDERLDLELDAGVYYALVAPWGWSTSEYDFRITDTASTDELPTDPPGEFPDVPYYGGSNDWGLNVLQVPEVWAQGYTGAGVTVAVVDTGVDLDHQDLVTNLWVNAGEIPGNGVDDDGNGFVDDVQGWDFANGDARPEDQNGHGTHVAGIIAAEQNGLGATGVAPDAVIMPVQVLGANGAGSSHAVAQGIRYAVDNGADIVNLSLGGGYSGAILAAIQYAEQFGVLVVAAAGNESQAVPSFPARFSESLTNVLSVGAHNANNEAAGFSNAVGGSGSVQVDAPGVGVYSAMIDNRYTWLSGTSMAAPQVAGIAALALQANSQLAPVEIRELIVMGADRTIAGSDSSGGANAATTVALAAHGTTSESTALAASVGAFATPITPTEFARFRRTSQASHEASPMGRSNDVDSNLFVFGARTSTNPPANTTLKPFDDANTESQAGLLSTPERNAASRDPIFSSDEILDVLADDLHSSIELLAATQLRR